MNILLINKNMVVSKLVKISAKELSASLDEIEVASNISKESYDLIIIDESALTPSLETSLKQLVIKYSLLLSNSSSKNKQAYDVELKKPFLPQDLTSVILQLTQKHNHEEDSKQMTTLYNQANLLDKIIALEPQKIKDILAGAKVSITIEFPKES